MDGAADHLCPPSALLGNGRPTVHGSLLEIGGLPNGCKCGVGSGSGDSAVVDVLSEWAPVLITVAILVFFQLLAFIFFLGRRQRSKRSRARKTKII